jgi:hypothetical protein
VSAIPASHRPRPRVDLVTSPACHFCEDAHDVLARLAADGVITLNEAQADSSRGATLIGVHRPALFPLVLVDGAFFSAGRLPRRKLAHAFGLEGAI